MEKKCNEEKPNHQRSQTNQAICREKQETSENLHYRWENL